MSKRQTTEELVAEMNRTLPDPSLDLSRGSKVTASIKSWVLGIRNAWKNLKTQSKDQNIFAVWTPANVRAQIMICTFLVECVHARECFTRSKQDRELLTKDLPNGRASTLEELTYNRTTNSNTPMRMLVLQRNIMRFNTRRNEVLTSRATALGPSTDQFKSSREMYKDFEYSCTDKVVAFQVALQEVLDEYCFTFHQRMRMKHFVVHPWTMNQCLSVFGTMGDSPSMLHEKPVVIVPFEFIESLSEDGQEDAITDIMAEANKQRCRLNIRDMETKKFYERPGKA